MKKKCMDKGSKERSPPHNLGRNRVNTYAVRITMLIADIEDDIMDPVMQCTTLSQPFKFLSKELVSFVMEIHTTSIDSIDFLTPKNPSRRFFESTCDHRIHKDGDGDCLIPLESNSLPHATLKLQRHTYKPIKIQES
ncbi:hypothetical protein Tco_1110999 [Tanacetum coccineum]|uniref:Uncharacterized protein n=1 Tax=Tanacetum coccineum TaxID=301880 RepID=A0ABQ5IKV1_9ASTR